MSAAPPCNWVTKKPRADSFLATSSKSPACAANPGCGKAFDGARAFGQYVIGAILAQHQQRALDLPDRLPAAGPVLPGARCRGKRRRARSRWHRGCCGFRAPLIPAAVAPGRGATSRRDAAAPACRILRRGRRRRGARPRRPSSARNRHRGTGNSPGPIPPAASRCHFQRHRLVVPRRVATQAVGDVEDGSGQSPIVRLTGGGTFLGDLGGTFVEGRQRGGGAGAKPVPVVLGGRQQLAQAADVGQQSFGFGWRRGRHHAFQPIGGANHRQGVASRGGAGGEVQRFAQRLLRNFSLALAELLDCAPRRMAKRLASPASGRPPAVMASSTPSDTHQ
jgi:hypothetical protein